MKLVWVVIPLLLIGIIGVQESFATPPTPPKLFDVETTISNLPALGETAEVTVKVTNLINVSWNAEEHPDTKIKIILRNGFEFVDMPPNKISTYKSGTFEYVKYKEQLEIGPNETQTISATVKAISIGEGFLSGGVGSENAGISIFIDENKTIFFDEYVESHPDYLIIREAKKQAAKFQNTIIMNGNLRFFEVEGREYSTMYNVQDRPVMMFNLRGQFITVSYDTAVELILRGYLVPELEPIKMSEPEPELKPQPTESDFVFEDQPEEFIREQLEQMGYSPEEIEEIIIDIRERNS